MIAIPIQRNFNGEGDYSFPGSAWAVRQIAVFNFLVLEKLFIFVPL